MSRRISEKCADKALLTLYKFIILKLTTPTHLTIRSCLLLKKL